MGKTRKRFQRVKPEKRYKKVFHIFTEGKATEPLYFEMLRQKFSDSFVINIYSSKNRTSASQLLKLANNQLKKERPKKGDMLWIVLDTDRNKREELQELFNWCNENKYCHVALSKPSFEYWLLLHFDPGDKVKGQDDCLTRLKKHLPNYSKNYLDEKRLWPQTSMALTNAKSKYAHCNDWFTDNHSMVFQLVEKFFEISNS